SCYHRIHRPITWIPAFAGMTSLLDSISQNEARSLRPAQLPGNLLQQRSLVTGQTPHAFPRNLVQQSVHVFGALFWIRIRRRYHRTLRAPFHYRVAARHCFIRTWQSVATLLRTLHLGNRLRIGIIRHSRDVTANLVEARAVRRVQIDPREHEATDVRHERDRPAGISREVRERHPHVPRDRPYSEPHCTNRHDAEYVDLVVGPLERVGENHTDHRAGCADHSTVLLEQQMEYSAAESAPQIEVGECTRSERAFHARAEHPQHDHVRRDVREARVYEHVGADRPPVGRKLRRRQTQPRRNVCRPDWRRQLDEINQYVERDEPLDSRCYTDAGLEIRCVEFG